MFVFIAFQISVAISLYIFLSLPCVCAFPLYTEPKERFVKSSKIFKSLQNLHSELVKNAGRKRKKKKKKEGF